MELVQGRPKSEDGREAKEIRVYNLLDELGIKYDRVDHKRADTMADCAAIDEVLQAAICKNLFLCNTQKTRFYMLMIVGDKKFKTKDISKQIGSSRLSFAPYEYMEEFLDILPGSVSVMGLMNDKEKRVQLLMDRELVDTEYFGCHPCVNTSSLRLRTKELLEKFLPSVEHEPWLVSVEPEEERE